MSSDTELLTVEDLAKLLKMKPEAVYELTRKRIQKRHVNPVPICRIGGLLRFRKAAIEQWLERCSEQTKSRGR